MAVERLKQMIQDENSGNGDVIRASSLIFDRLPREGGPVQAVGDYEIVLKDGS